jgi:hypothetical protein
MWTSNPGLLLVGCAGGFKGRHHQNNAATSIP